MPDVRGRPSHCAGRLQRLQHLQRGELREWPYSMRAVRFREIPGLLWADGVQ